MGTVLWGMFVVMVLLHAMAGNMAGPVFAMIVAMSGLAVRQLRRRMLRAS